MKRISFTARNSSELRTVNEIFVFSGCRRIQKVINHPLNSFEPGCRIGDMTDGYRATKVTCPLGESPKFLVHIPESFEVDLKIPLPIVVIVGRESVSYQNLIDEMNRRVKSDCDGPIRKVGFVNVIQEPKI